LFLIGYQAGAIRRARSTLLIPSYGWQVMPIGALLPIAAALLVLAALPESGRHLPLDPNSRPSSRSAKDEPLQPIDRDARLIVHEEKKSGFRLPYLSPGRAVRTPLLWGIIFIANLMALQFPRGSPTVLESVPTCGRRNRHRTSPRASRRRDSS
jgi:hypothetical protein